MKTVEELEALLEAVTRERDLSLFAWESAGMQGRDAQSAMLELARQLEDAQADVAAAKTALDDVGWLEDERDKARAWAHRAEHERDEARAEAERWRTSYDAASGHAVDVRAMLDQVRKELYESRAEVERLMHQLADATNESTHFQVMCKRETEEVERLARQVELLTDERDELLVRVANQDAELRATREAYIDAKWTNAYRRGAEAMREACASAMRPIMRSMISRTEAAQTIRALPIPEEP